MSVLKEPIPVKAVFALIFAHEENTESVKNNIQKKFGRIDYLSPITSFSQSSFYENEMGKPLYRQWLSIESLQKRNSLIDTKLWVQSMEPKDAAGRRLVNIDPAILSQENFILATGKNFSHRIYLGKGVFADLTLIYEKDGYKPLPWTYPDYRENYVLKYLNDIRLIYRNQLKTKNL